MAKKRRNWIEERDNIVSGARKLTNVEGSYEERVKARKSLNDNYKRDIIPNNSKADKTTEFKGIINSVKNLPNVNQLQQTITASYNSLNATQQLAKNRADIEKALNNANKFKATYGADKNINEALSYLNNIKNLIDNETKGGSAATNMIIDRNNALAKGNIAGAQQAEAKGNILNAVNLSPKFDGKNYKDLKKTKTETPAEADYKEGVMLREHPLDLYKDNKKEIKKLKNKKYETTGWGGSGGGSSEYDDDQARIEKLKEQNSIITSTLGPEIEKRLGNDYKALRNFNVADDKFTLDLTNEEKDKYLTDKDTRTEYSRATTKKILQDKYGLSSKEASILLDYEKNASKQENREAAAMAGERRGRLNSDLQNLVSSIGETVGYPVSKGLESIVGLDGDYSHNYSRARNEAATKDKGTIGKGIYNMAETVGTIASAGLWGGAAFVPFAAKAADDSYYNAIDKGASEDEALNYATNSAITTGLIYSIGLKGINKITQAATNGGEGIVRSLAKEIVDGKASSSLGKAVLKDMAKTGVKQGADFAALTTSSQIADTLNQIATLGKNSDFELQKRQYMAQGMSESEAEDQVLQDTALSVGENALSSFAGGALMGAVTSGIGSMKSKNAYTDIANKRAEYEADFNKYTNDMKSEYFNDVKNTADLEEQYKARAKELHPDVEGGSEEAFTQLTADRERIEGILNGEYSEEAKQAIDKWENFVNYNREILGLDRVMTTKEKEQLDSQFSDAKNNLLEFKGKLEDIEPQTEQEAVEIKETIEKIDNEIAKAENNVEATNDIVISESNLLPPVEAPVNVEPVKELPAPQSVENKNITVDDELNDRQVEIVEKGMKSDMSEDTLNKMLSYENTNISPTEYADAFSKMYVIGKDSNVKSFKNAVDVINKFDDTVIDNLTPEVAAIAYTAGKNDAPVKNIKTMLNRKPSGMFAADFEPKDENEMFVNETLSNLAKFTGLDIILSDDLTKYKELKDIPKNTQGVAFTDAGRMALNRDTANILGVAMHESMHFAKKLSPEAYEEYAKIVSDVLREDLGVKGFDEQVRKIQNEYKEAGQNLSYDEALEEALAYATETLALNENALSKVVERVKESSITDTQKKNILDIIKEWIDRAIAAIKERISKASVRSGTEAVLKGEQKETTEALLKSFEAMRKNLETAEVSEEARGESKFSMNDANRGYSGYSMSNRAVEAYENGEKPLSKWTKGDIIQELKEISELTSDQISEISKYKLKDLKDVLLDKTSWHHTSSKFNKTDFYSVKEIEDFDSVIKELENANNKVETKEPERRIKGEFQVWGGTAKKPKLLGTETLEGVKKGDWLVTDDGTRRKLSANKTVSWDYIVKNEEPKTIKEGYINKDEFNNFVDTMRNIKLDESIGSNSIFGEWSKLGHFLYAFEPRKSLTSDKMLPQAENVIKDIKWAYNDNIQAKAVYLEDNGQPVKFDRRDYSLKIGDKSFKIETEKNMLGQVNDILKDNVSENDFSNWVNNKLGKGASDNVKFSLSEKGKELSTEYNEAVKDNNIAAAEKLVEEYAKGAGYTQKVYHGTQQFGFTKIDLNKSDDRTTFWATDDIETAQTYSGTKDLKAKQIKDAKKPISELTPEEKIKLYNKGMEHKEKIKFYNKDNKEPIRKYIEGEKEHYEKRLLNSEVTEEDIDRAYEWWEGDRPKEFLRELAEKVNEIQNKISKLYNTVKDNLYSEEALKTLKQIRTLEREDLNTLNGILTNRKYWSVEDMLNNLSIYLANDDYYVINNGHFLTDKNMQRIIEEYTDYAEGNYEFYANTDNFLTVDAEEANWNNIRYDTGQPEDTNEPRFVKTRDIAKDAMKKGYEGVIIKNVLDNGGRGRAYIMPSNIYIFFNPTEQVKSADPITYDDKGNVIPLEERFNPKNNDLRFSLAPTEDSEDRELSEGQREYFKDSKIRDNEGKLLTVYHGTPNKFTVFDISNGRPDMDIQAAFFTPVREEAEGYAGYNNGNVGEFYLNITNPADYDTAYAIFDKYKGKNSDAGIKAREELEKLGYDGVFVEDEDYPEYLAFKPEQIKNIDNLNPTTNEDIRKSLSQKEADDRIEHFREVHEDIGRQLKILNGPKLSNAKLKTMAQAFKRELGSKIDTYELTDQLNKLFTLVENKKGNINNTDVMDKAHQIVKDVMEQAKEVEPEVKQFIDDMRTKKIYMTDRDKAEITDYNYFRKSAFGKLRLVNSKDGALPVDEFFTELENYHPEVYDQIVGRGNNADAGNLIDLVDWINAAKDGSFSLYDMEGDSAVEHYALELLNNYAAAKVEDITNNKAKQRELYKNIGQMVEFAEEQQKELNKANYEAQSNKAQYLKDLQSKQSEIGVKLEEQKQDLQNSYNKTLNDEIAKVKDKYSERQAKAIAKLKTAQRERLKKWSEDRKRTDERQKVRRTRDRLKTTINKPTVKKYVPTPLHNAVSKLFNSIDLGEQWSIDRLNTMRDNAMIRYTGEELADKLAKIDAQEYKFVNELTEFKGFLEQLVKGSTDDSDTYFAPVINMIDNTINKVGKKSLMNMSSDELRNVNQTLRAIEKATTERNRPQTFKLTDENGKQLETYEEAARLGLQQTKDMDLVVKQFDDSTKLKKYKNLPGKAKQAFKISHMTGTNLMYAMGGFNPNSIMGQFADQLNKAYVKESEVKQILGDMISPVLSEKEGKTDFTLKSEVARRYSPKDLVDVGLKNRDGKPILLNHDNLIFEYLNLANDENLTHFARGGSTFPDYDKLYNRKASYGDKNKRTSNVDAEIRAIESKMETALENEDYNALRSLAAEKKNILEKRKSELREIRRNIGRNLTDYDRKVIKAWKEMLKVSTDMLNEYWNKTYGYEPFTVSNYWRIVTDPNFIKGSEGGNLQRAITNLSESGTTIARQEGAGNPLLSGSALFAIDDYINNTAKLIAYSGLQRDLNAVFKYTIPGYDNIQKIVEQTSGELAHDFHILQQDIFGGKQQADGKGMRGLATMRGLRARAVLSPTLRVALAQLPSYLGTARYTDAKALVRAFLPQNRVEREIIDKYTPMMNARGNNGFSLETSDLKADTNDLLRALNKADRLTKGWLFGMPLKADSFAVRSTFGAYLDFARRKFPYLAEGTPEQIANGESALYKKAAELFNEGTARTQPMFDPMNRNAWQRSSNEYAKTATMFHTQSFQYLNLLLRDIMSYKYEKAHGNASKAAKFKEAAFKTIAVIIAANSLYVIAKQVVNKTVLHRKDKIEPEDVLEQTLASFANMFVFGSTVVDGIYALIKKGTINDFESFGTGIINSMKDLIEQTTKAMQGKDVDIKRNIEEVLTGLGIPAANIDNHLSGVYKNVEDLIDGGEWYSNEADYGKQMSEEAKTGYEYAEGDITSKELNDYINGLKAPEGMDQEEYTKTETAKVKNKIKTTLQDEYVSGDITKSEAVKKLEDSGLFHSPNNYQSDTEYIQGLVTKWDIDSYKEAWVQTYGDSNGAKERKEMLEEIKKLPYDLAFPENPNVKPTYKSYKSSYDKLISYLSKWH